MDNACLKFELMGCEEPKVEPLLGFDYGHSPCVGKFFKNDFHINKNKINFFLITHYDETN